MTALDGWTALPLIAAAAAFGLIAARVRAVMFRAALDEPSFTRELRARVTVGELDAARTLVERLRPAWAAEVAARALDSRDDPNEQAFVLQDARAECELAAVKGLLAIRAIGRMALPLALAIAIFELGQGFAPTVDRALTASSAFTRGLFAVSVGMAVSFACQLSYGVLVREGQKRLLELDRLTAAVILFQPSETCDEHRQDP